MRAHIFQPILVRPGTRSTEHLAADAAVMSWQASRGWHTTAYQQWVEQGCRTSVRKSHLNDYLKACTPGWVGNEAACAGPLMRLDEAPEFVANGRTDGWMAWGTAEQPDADAELLVPMEPGDSASSFAARAVALLHTSKGYHGQTLKVTATNNMRGLIL